jgi:uncharacterized protein (UPF0548 family)
VLRLFAPSESLLDRVLAEAHAAGPTYPEVGATRSVQLPAAGYRIDRYQRRLGSEDDRFERAVDALRGWQGQIGAGVRVYPDGATVEGGGTVLFVVRTLGLWAVMPCRVVYFVDGESRFCFGYGTLPGHLERGEVAMSIERDEGAVVARIVSFSRTVHPLARLALPLARRMQTRFTNRYLDAIQTSSSPSQRSASK